MSDSDPIMEADLALLARFANGRDEEAFSQIVWRYADMVFDTCRRVLRDTALAQDATQETFLRLLNKPTAVKQSLAGWLHRTATRVAIDTIRQDTSRRHREAAYVAANAPSVSEWAEISPLIDEALDELPDDERALLVAHFLMGKSQREIIADSEMSPATMSRRIKSALESLRATLRKKGVPIAAAAFVGLLESRPASAAPAALTRELGKMALVSGSTYLHVSWKVLIKPVLAWSTLIAATAGLLWYYSTLPSLPVPPLFSRAAHHETAEKANPSSAEPHYIAIPGGAGIDSQRVTVFQDPQTADDGKIAVAFADGHTVSIPVGDARKIIEKQTGKTLEQLARPGATAGPAPTPGSP